MKKFISATGRRFLLAAALGAGGLLTACSLDEAATPVSVDYAATDEAIITKYLADNNITTAQRQPSGLYYVPVVANAAGTAAVAGKTVSVLYTGRFMNGTVFDASALHGNTPFGFVLGQGQVIRGWDIGIALMRKGEKGVLLLPSALGYGAAGAGSSIPPNTVLRFEVEVTDVQ